MQSLAGKQLRWGDQFRRGKVPGPFPGIGVVAQGLDDGGREVVNNVQGRGAMLGTDMLVLYKGGTEGRVVLSLNEADWYPVA
jgi:hypothetical protein